MPKLLAIDCGLKRTGIAITDELQIIASGLTTLPTEEVIPFLKSLCQKENIETIIVGQPKRMNNELSDIEGFIASFVENLKKELPQIPVVRYDERFTSKLAMQSLISSGISKKQRQNKALLDEVSATIILQDYMQSR